MPEWPSPDSTLIERVASLHKEAFDSSTPLVSGAASTWNFLGEHTDHIGGVVINAVGDLHVAVAASPRSDDTITVNTQGMDSSGEEINFTGSVTLAEVSQHATIMQHAEDAGAYQDSQLPIGGAEVRLAGVVWSMINRQYLSRDTRGFNITVLSEIPEGVGLGDEVAAEVAFAKILAEAAEHKLDAPLLARLADVCASSSRIFSAAPAFKARYTAALRGVPEAFNIVDYADGSVTQAPQLRDTDSYRTFLVSAPGQSIRNADVTAREKFVDAASAAFGVDYLRKLPDAPQRVAQWLDAVHKTQGEEGLPPLDEAQHWLAFYERETQRAQQTAVALRARKAGDALALVSESQADQVKLYGVSSEKEVALVELCLARGASAARSASAGSTDAVIVHATTKRASNMMTDLSDDGLTVVPLGGA